MSHGELIAAAARSLASLAPALAARPERELKDIERGIARGHFTPEEDDRIRERFATYLTARAGMLETIRELRPIALAPAGRGDDHERVRAFAIAYTAAAVLVRAARFIVEQYACHAVIQRKLDEAEPRFGLPRKQFTMIYRAVTSPVNAWQIADAARFASAHRSALEALGSDPLFVPVLQHLRQSEAVLRRGTADLVKARLAYRWHSLRRRRASAFQHALFSLFELSGRVIADMRNPFHAKRLTTQVVDSLGALLQPGDVLVTRHDDAMSNLFLPGYWIHTSLHIGRACDRDALGVTVDDQRRSRWIDPIRVLEARKDGVLLRALNDTLHVDAVAVIRPRIAAADLVAGLSRALSHEGKLYDFEFDFFRSDRLVCTEVVYRGFHGVGGLDFPITRRAGRPTLSSEDLLRMAIGHRGYETVAVFGAPGCKSRIVQDADAHAILAATLASDPVATSS